LNLSYFISKRISKAQKEGFSGIIHTIAVVSIAIGLAASIVSFLIMKGFQDTVKNKFYGFSGHVLITKLSMSNSPEEQPLDFNIDVYKNQSAYPYVKHVQEYAHKAGLIKTEDEVFGVMIKGVGKSFDQQAFQKNIIAGKFLTLPDSGYANQVVLSSIIAKQIKANVGDELVIHFFQNPPRFRKVKVSGIYETNLSEYFDSRIIIGDIRLIQRLNGWADSVAGGLEVYVDFDKFNIRTLQSQAAQQISENEEMSATEKSLSYITNYVNFDFEKAAIDWAEEDIGERMDFDLNVLSASKRFSQIFEWLNLISRQVNILLIIILTVVCVNMISIVLILVMERTQMIGMLKAVGASNRLVRSIFVYSGINLILKGLLLGNVLGLGICFIQDKFKIVKLNPRDYYMDVVPISWNADIVVILNILTLIIVSLVLLLPTMAIASINPIKAIKFD
jgi:lipoprotein-releasing system permease protein